LASRPPNPPFLARSRTSRLAEALLALGLAACGPSTPDPVALLERGHLDRAVLEKVDEAVRAARASPGDAAAHGQLGLVYEANDLWREAAASLANAALLDPGEPLWRYHQAIALTYLGRSEEALVLLQQCARDLPEAPYVWQRLGEALLEEGRASEARAAFETLVALAPEQPEGHVGLGAASLHLGDTSRAGAALERAVFLDPRYASAHYQLGLVYREIGRLQEAERELALGVGGRTRFLPDPLSQELRRAAVTTVALLARALDLLNNQNPERAARILEGLLEDHPDDVTIGNDLAIALQRMGRFEEARVHLEHALEMAPTEAGTWSNLAALDLDQGLNSAALEKATRAIELAPGSSRAQLMLARVLQRLGRTDEAFAALEEAVRLAPTASEPLELLGRTAIEVGRLGRAQEAYRSLAQLEPLAPTARLGLAEVLLRRGRVPQARREWEVARTLAPDDPAVQAFGARLQEAR
jgi:Flp pilus assembly protein TadD